MKAKTVVLIIATLLIMGSILYLESLKARPGDLDVASSLSPIATDDSKSAVEDPEPGSGGLSAILKSARYKKSPDLAGIVGYINTDDSISIKKLNEEGNIVLVDFWTYSCVNCIRTLPYLTDWHAKYADKGLVIIGVHTPEFTFEKKRENVLKAAERYGVEYPIVQDNNYATWTAFNNRYWPHKFLIDTDGYIRYDHIGEGAYEETERKIQELLVEIGVEEVRGAETVKEDIRNYLGRITRTPELYAGYNFALTRFQNVGNPEGLQPDQTVDYILPAKIRNNEIYLDGLWFSDRDNLESKEAETSVVLSYSGAEVNIVAESISGEPIKLSIMFDDAPISEDFAGDDVESVGVDPFIEVDEPRLYNILRGEQGRHTITLTADSEGFTFHAFTFG